MSSSDELDESEDPVELAQDLVALATELSSELIRSATLSQLILVLPLVLNSIGNAHGTSSHSNLIDPLCERLHRSRRLKLRFLLLRHHPVFKSLPIKLRFSTHAYERSTHQPYVSRTACSKSHLDLSLDEDGPVYPTWITLKVDMVDLQSENVYSQIIFKKFETGSFQRVCLQLFSHVFEPRSDDSAPDEVCTAVYDSESGVDEDANGTGDEEQNIGHMAYLRANRNETVVDIRQAMGEIKTTDEVQRLRSSSSSSSSSTFSRLTSTADTSVTKRGSGATANGTSNKNHRRKRSRNLSMPWGHTVDNVNQNDASSNDEEDESLPLIFPRISVRATDDVLRVQVVTMTLQLMNEMWRRHWSVDPLSAPFVMTYDSVATSATQGIVEVIPGEGRTMNTGMDDPIMIDQLIRSMAGAVTAGYVLGIHHQDLALRDGCTAFWKATPHTPPGPPGPSGMKPVLSFLNLFENSGPPPAALPKHFKTGLKQLQAWDMFRRLCVQAFVALRSSWHDVFAPVVVPLFVKCGISRLQIDHYVQGKHGLHLRERDDLQSQVHFRKAIS